MSDFTSNFWSTYVTAISLGGILACALLLWLTARFRGTVNADNTTGHVWDEDLREMNNPLPRWWMWLFILTIVFSIGYLVIYPGLGKYNGSIAWTSRAEYDKEVDKANHALAPIYAAYVAEPVERLADNPAAMAIGERLFLNNCAQCHGSDARGSKGFPNLTDNDWLYGGAPENIQQSITHGRIGVMAPVAEAVGSSEDVKNVAHYVLSLSGSPHDAARANLGKDSFAAVCAACHGADGKGSTLIGAANLTDNIWLHGSGEAAIIAMVNEGKINQMPAQDYHLTDAQIHVLTAYVWGLSNKPAAAQ